MAEQTSKKAIIVGASSGIGWALAYVLAREGYTVGLCARRLARLAQLQSDLSKNSFISLKDITSKDAFDDFESFLQSQGQVDLIVISAGTGHINPELEWNMEKDTVEVNVKGFTAIADASMRFFMKQGYGHLVGISSMAKFRGNADTPAYNASKAYVSNYLEGLRMIAAKKRLPIDVTDIRPGFVLTDMAKGKQIFWAATPEKAALQMYADIRKRRKVAYITRRWRFVSWALRILPECIYCRF
ncbi:MAG: SDR family NAD(P)-dependent oxidoreductase [Victivallaceae bacterium]|jgi:short-subunit dehydrogenase